jgi:hypothetical protein
MEAYMKRDSKRFKLYKETRKAKMLVEKLIKNPPNRIELFTKIHCQVEDLEDLSNYCQKRYGFDIGIDEDAEGFEQLFYNADLRSYMGELIDWDGAEARFWILPKYYVAGQEDQWEKLLRDSKVISHS